MNKRLRKQSEPAPVQQIELDESRPRLRMVLVIALLALAMLAFGIAIWRRTQAEAGWTEIVYTGAKAETVAGDMKLLYELEAGTATATFRELTQLFNETSETAYQLFDPSRDYASEGVQGLGTVLAHAGEEVEVEPALYRAFSLFEEADSRLLYLGPVYEVYQSLFYSATDAEAEAVDPFVNAEVARFCREAAHFAADPAMIDLELSGQNRVTLHVAEEYAAFAKENGFYSYLDFFWMRNAFAADVIADALAARGYTKGQIASRDGFSRCLDARKGQSYTATIPARSGQVVRVAATMEYAGPLAMAALRDYPLADSFDDYYYEREDGSIRTPYVDPADGLSRTSLPELTAYSYEKSCAEVALAAASLFIGKGFDAAAAKRWADDGVYMVYAEGEELSVTDSTGRAVFRLEAGE